MPEDEKPQATLDDVLGRLKIVTYDLNTLRRYTAVIVVATAVQAVLIALWALGIITVEFKAAR